MESLNEFQKGIVIRQLEERLQDIESQKQDLDKEKHEILAAIKSFKSSERKSDVKGKRQSLLKGQDFTWKEISLEVLKDKRRVLTTDEIFSEFLLLKPEFKEHPQKNVQASFSSALSQLAEKNEVVRIERRFGKGNFWALPEWFNSEDGEPMPEIREQLEKLHVGDFRFIPWFSNFREIKKGEHDSPF